MAGRWLQGGSDGPLGSEYELGANNVLEFKVVTIDVQHLVDTPTQNEDLFRALGGWGYVSRSRLLFEEIKGLPIEPTVDQTTVNPT